MNMNMNINMNMNMNMNMNEYEYEYELLTSRIVFVKPPGKSKIVTSPRIRFSTSDKIPV